MASSSSGTQGNNTFIESKRKQQELELTTMNYYYIHVDVWTGIFATDFIHDIDISMFSKYILFQIFIVKSKKKLLFYFSVSL